MKPRINVKELYAEKILGPASNQFAPSAGNDYLVLKAGATSYSYFNSVYGGIYHSDKSKMLHTTVDAAINATTAGRGDKIYVLEGHTESLATAAAWAVDKAGTRIIGVGIGTKMPTITVATDSDEAAPVLISANDCEISGIRFVGGKTGGSKDTIEISGSYVTIRGCEFIEAAATTELGVGAAYGVITILDASAAVTEVRILDCIMQGAAGDDESFLSVTDGSNGATWVYIDGCKIIGTFADDAIQADAGTNVNTNWVVQNSIIANKGGNHIAMTIDTGAVFYMHNLAIFGDASTTAPLVGYNASYQGAVYTCEPGSSQVAIGSATNWSA